MAVIWVVVSGIGFLASLALLGFCMKRTADSAGSGRSVGQTAVAWLMVCATIVACSLAVGRYEYVRCEEAGGATIDGGCWAIKNGELRKVSTR